jgi:uncharacterized membrane protein YwzB
MLCIIIGIMNQTNRLERQRVNATGADKRKAPGSNFKDIMERFKASPVGEYGYVASKVIHESVLPTGKCLFWAGVIGVPTVSFATYLLKEMYRIGEPIKAAAKAAKGTGAHFTFWMSLQSAWYDMANFVKPAIMYCAEHIWVTLAIVPGYFVAKQFFGWLKKELKPKSQ